MLSTSEILAMENSIEFLVSFSCYTEYKHISENKVVLNKQQTLKFIETGTYVIDVRRDDVFLEFKNAIIFDTSHYTLEEKLKINLESEYIIRIIDEDIDCEL